MTKNKPTITPGVRGEARRKMRTDLWRQRLKAQKEGQPHGKKKPKPGTKNKAQAEQEQNIPKCMVCCVEYTANTVKDHYSSDLHKELVEVKRNMLFKARFHKTLGEQIEKEGGDMPFLGLRHIRQYQPNENGEHQYECGLCKDVYRPRHVFYHVLSVQHRVNYLARHHKSMGITRNYEVKTREQYQNLLTCAANAEKIDGRQEIKIMDHVFIPKEEYNKTAGGKEKGKTNEKADKAGPSRPPTGIGMDTINQALARVGRPRIPGGPVPSQPGDFQSGHPSDGGSKKQDDMMKLLLTFLNARSKMPGGSMSDSNQKAAMAGAAAGSGMPRATTQPKLNPLLRNPIAFIKGGQASGPMMTETGISEDLNLESVAAEIPRRCIPDCFWCNEELYDFLGRVTVENQEDMDYVLKVTELLSNALVRHKQRTYSIKMRIEEEKKRLEKEKKAFLNKPGVDKLLQKLEHPKPRSRSRSPHSRASAGKHKAGRSRSPPRRSPPRSKSPPRRLSDSSSNPASARPGNQPDRNRPQGYNTGPSATNTNPSPHRMPGSQFSQSGPSSLQGPGIGKTGSSTANSNPSEQSSVLGPVLFNLFVKDRTEGDSRNPALQGLGSGSKEMKPSENQPRLAGKSGNHLEPSFNASDRPVNKPMPSWQEWSMEMGDSRVNASKPPVNTLGQSWLGQRPELGESRVSMNDSDPTFGSRPSWQGQSIQSRPSYGMSDSYTDSDTSYKENERYPGSQYGISGPTAGAISYGPGAGRPGGSKDGYSTNYSTSYPLKYSLGSFLTAQMPDSQSGQRPAAMGTSYGAALGNWSRGPGSGASQGTASYNESWK